MHMHMFCEEQPTMCLAFLHGFCSAQAACHEASDASSAGKDVNTAPAKLLQNKVPKSFSLFHVRHCPQSGVIVCSMQCKLNDKAGLRYVVEGV